jgi:hypothetical protein
VRLNQPQPPGYPLYVVLGRVLNFFAHDPQLALTLLSALAGAATLLAFYALAAGLGVPWAALPLAVAPLFWLSAGMALSDVPGLCVATGSVWLLLKAAPREVSRASKPESGPRVHVSAGSKAYLVGGAALAGLAAGVRPQDAIIPLSVLALYAGPRLRSARWLGASLAACVATCLVWAVPLALSLGGLGAAVQAMLGQGTYVGGADSLLARPLSWANLGERLAEFGSVFSAYLGGLANGGLAAMLALLAAAATLALVAMLANRLGAGGAPRPSMLDFLRSWGGDIVARILARSRAPEAGGAQGASRLGPVGAALGGTAPPLDADGAVSGQAAEPLGADGLRDGRALSLGADGASIGPTGSGIGAHALVCRAETAAGETGSRLVYLALVWLLPYGALMVLAFRPDDPRKILPALPPLILLFAGAFKRLPWASPLACVGLAAFFALRAVPLVHELDTQPPAPNQAAAYVASQASPRDTVVVAGASYNAVHYLLPDVHAYLLDDLDSAALNRDLSAATHLFVLDKEGFTPPSAWLATDTRTFARDPLVLPKASTVWLEAYEPLPGSPASLGLPADGQIHVGSSDDIAYLLSGWDRPEVIAGVPARWTDRQAQIRFYVDKSGAARVTLVGVAYPAGQQLTVSINGQPAARLAMRQDWAPYSIAVPAGMFHPRAVNTITLDHSEAISAYDATGGQSLDRRPLAAAYQLVGVTWQ